jgi:basic amino acid/polyamine antiporter, APA family
MQDSSAGLARDLGRWQLLAITVGAVVGASIYLRPAMVAQALGTPWRILLAWTVAGAISLAGALSYAQLAARWPRAGGEYVYLGETMGEPAAFLFGWMRITVGVAAAAGQATAVIVFLADLLPVGGPWAHWTISALGVPLAVAIGARQLLAVLVIAALAFLNCLGVGKAGHFQAALTVLKVAALLCVVAILLSAARHATSTAASYSLAAPGANGWSTALLGAITAFNGWTLAAMLGGETRDAERAVPWALCWGMAIATVCYLAANLGYLAALPVATARPAANQLSTRTPRAPPASPCRRPRGRTPAAGYRRCWRYRRWARCTCSCCRCRASSLPWRMIACCRRCSAVCIRRRVRRSPRSSPLPRLRACWRCWAISTC